MSPSDYKIVTSGNGTLQQFEKAMRWWLENGWYPIGGVAVSTTPQGLIEYHQAVFLPSAPPIEPPTTTP